MTKKESKDRQKFKTWQQIQATLDFLHKNFFEKREDVLKEYSANGEEIYCIPLEGTQCLVVQHYALNEKLEFQGFTLWISEYKNYQDIGRRPAISITNLLQEIDIEKHRSFIEGYLYPERTTVLVR